MAEAPPEKGEVLSNDKKWVGQYGTETVFVAADKRGWVAMAEAPAKKEPIPSIDHEGNSDMHDILHCLCFQSCRGCHSNKHRAVMVVPYLWDCDPIYGKCR